MSFSSNTCGIARIVKTTPDGMAEKHVGMAFIIDARHVMTCCHVLNDALGRENRLDPETPPPEKRFSIRFPYASNAKGSGGVVLWCLELQQAKDVAVLKLEDDAPADAHVATFSEFEVQGEKWSCIGRDATEIDREAHGELGSILASQERQLNGPTGIAVRIAGGYSGAGVWSDAPNAFVGMVVTKDRDQFENGVAYAIPTCILLQVWPKLKQIRDGHLFDPNLTDAQANWAVPVLPPTVAVNQPAPPRRPSSPSYFCYVSRQKVDQLHSQIVDEQPTERFPSNPGAPDEAGLSAGSVGKILEDASYGMRGVVQRERKVKTQYIEKLRRVVTHIAAEGPIPSLESLLSTDKGGRGFFHYRGEFRPVTPLSGPVPSETLVVLKSQAGGRTLLLDCSLRNFSEGNAPDGSFRVHSGNHRFFSGQIGLWLETVAVYFDATADEIYGSPLFLKLGMRPASAMVPSSDHMPVL
ncbi:MAG: trypsin-like peptidase domain-containing protein [Isosphaerales bacterium]